MAFVCGLCAFFINVYLISYLCESLKTDEVLLGIVADEADEGGRPEINLLLVADWITNDAELPAPPPTPREASAEWLGELMPTPKEKFFSVVFN